MKQQAAAAGGGPMGGNKPMAPPPHPPGFFDGEKINHSMRNKHLISGACTIYCSSTTEYASSL